MQDLIRGSHGPGDQLGGVTASSRQPSQHIVGRSTGPRVMGDDALDNIDNIDNIYLHKGIDKSLIQSIEIKQFTLSSTLARLAGALARIALKPFGASTNRLLGWQDWASRFDRPQPQGAGTRAPPTVLRTTVWAYSGSILSHLRA